jgi:hypothetical protein
MTATNAMRTFTAVPVPAVKHPSRRRSPRLRTGPVSAILMLSCACALLAGGTTVSAARPSPSAKPSPSLQPLPVVVAPTPRPAPRPAPVAPRPAPPLVLPVASPAPRPAPVATSPPGAVEGVQVPSPVNLPPVAVLPAPAPSAAGGRSVVPLGLLAAFVATLLIATGLTARRRL